MPSGLRAGASGCVNQVRGGLSRIAVVLRGSRSPPVNGVKKSRQGWEKINLKKPPVAVRDTVKTNYDY